MDNRTVAPRLRHVTIRRIALLAALALTLGATGASAAGGQASATIAKTASGYELRVTNLGPTTITYLVFVPGELVVTAGQRGFCSVLDGTLLCNGLTIAPGKTVAISLTATGTPAGGKLYVNDHAGNDGIAGPFAVGEGGTTTPPAGGADLAVDLKGPATLSLTRDKTGKDVRGRAIVTYVVTVTNLGPAAADATLTVAFSPLRLRIDSPSCKPKEGVASTSTCALGQLAKSASKTVRVKVIFNAGDRARTDVGTVLRDRRLRVTAVVSGTAKPDPPGNNRDVATTIVRVR